MPVVSQVLETVLTLNTARFQQGAAQAEREIDRLQGRINRFSTQGAIAGTIAAAGFAILGKAALEAGEDTASFARAVASFKGGFPLADMQEFTGGLQRLVGIEDDVIARSLGLLGTFGLTADEAKKLELPILNATEALKAQGATAESVATQVGKAIEAGNASALRRSGIIIDQDAFAGADRAERVRLVMEALQRQAGDAAVVFRSTLPGAIQAFNTEIQSAFGNVGKALDGPAAGMLNWLIQAIQKFNDAGPVVHGAAAIIGGALVAGATAAWVALKALELQNIALMNSMLRTTAAAKGQGAALAGVGGKGGGGRIAGGALAALAGFGIDQAIGDVAANDQSAGGALKRIGKGAGLGAGIGSFFGLPGALIGGALGGGKGAIESIMAGPLGGGKKSEAEKQREATEKNTAALEKNTEATKQGGGAVSTSDVPLYRQLAARQVRVFGS